MLINNKKPEISAFYFFFRFRVDQSYAGLKTISHFIRLLHIISELRILKYSFHY